ncbi:MAG: hypothetical protein HOV67_36695 [Kribbellaceae bacterium]|nr:hypothetical protein [Kribbellaceae bacterium]
MTQATKAALLVTDLPKGWEGGVASDPTPTLRSSVKYAPENCWQVRNPTRDRGAPASAVRGQYFIRVGDNPISVTEFIYSWTTPQLPIVQRISEILPQCAAFTATWYGGETFRASVRQLSVPGLRDGIVLRTDYPDPPNATGYVAYVARGGTLLELEGANDTFTGDGAFVRLVTTAVARLDAAIG